MRPRRTLAAFAIVFAFVFGTRLFSQSIGQEVALNHRLANGEEFTIPLRDLIDQGFRVFTANWTTQEGGGRPLTKGTGGGLSTPGLRLEFPRNFNRISAPDSNSCAGCHNAPFGVAGGGGDIVSNVFVLGQRFDFATMNLLDTVTTGGTLDENGQPVTLQTIANSRNTLGMFGSGYIEMLARQITADLQATRDAIPPGGSAHLQSKGLSFGVLTHLPNGSWDTSQVTGLQASSLATPGGAPPNLLIRPFHQAGAVVSLRQFTNNAMNHHHGIQTTERFPGDPDGDGFANELSEADVTAVTVFQATMAVPGRVIPNNRQVEAAIARGELLFQQIGCATCHVPSLPLDKGGWVFTEPSQYNPPGNRQTTDGPVLSVDLTSPELPLPRLRPQRGVVWVPAFTDLRLHDITSGPSDPNREPLDMHQAAGSPEFFAGNSRFITRKLWGAANEPPYFHHGQYTTMREAVLAHHGEAEFSGSQFAALPGVDKDAVIEFLKSLQVLPPGSPSLVVDERGRPRTWTSIF